MALDSLSDKLQSIFKNLRGKGVLTEKDVKDVMREIKLALLDADVNFKIVKEFIATVTEKAVGTDVLKSLTPSQGVIKIVNEELTALMGSVSSSLTFSEKPPTVFMLVGLQGAGKTTTVGKLAGKLKNDGRRPLLVAADIYRPAAIKQLEVVASNFNIPVFSKGTDVSPVIIANEGIEHAKKNNNDVVIIDTAGRLHIDEELMNELKDIKKSVRPQEIILVIDAMTGQDAVNVAKTFNEELGIDGVIVTKLDGDARGGATLSVKAVTNKPIKYICTGEKLTDIEVFHPDRMASRILGMGDVLSLIEKAEQAFDQDSAKDLEKKLKTNDFNLEDFLEQMQQVKKMGPLQDIIGMIPGMPKNLNDANLDEKQLDHVEAIIRSMTPAERRDPDIINGSRKKRIAAGSGLTVMEVNKLLKQFKDMKVMMKQFSGMSKKGKKGMFGGFGF